METPHKLFDALILLQSSYLDWLFANRYNSLVGNVGLTIDSGVSRGPAEETRAFATLRRRKEFFHFIERHRKVVRELNNSSHLSGRVRCVGYEIFPRNRLYLKAFLCYYQNPVRAPYYCNFLSNFGFDPSENFCVTFTSLLQILSFTNP